MPGLKENVNCPRRMVVFAVFDIIDKLDGEYERAMAGDIKAKVKVLGKTSEYAFAVTDTNTGYRPLEWAEKQLSLAI